MIPDPPLRHGTDERWKARFRAARMTLPQWARLRPQRSMFACNASGTVELYTWDREKDEVRQATSRPAGTHVGALDPLGEQLWWFDDDAGNEFGVWRRQPFDGARPHVATESDRPTGSVGAGPAAIAVAGLDASYSAGLALATDGSAVIGRSLDAGTSIHWARPDGTVSTIYEHREEASVSALSADGTLLALAHSEHGDSRHQALRILALGSGGVAPEAVADLWDGPGLGLRAVGFAPLPGDMRLLVLHEREGRWLPLIWDVRDGSQTDLELTLPGDLSADWYPDGDALLVGHEYRARSELLRLDLASGTLSVLAPARGTIAGATARPDGAVEFLWSSGAEPSAVRDVGGRVVIRPPGPQAPPSVAVEDAWVDGTGGPIHALISKPDAATPPLPTVFVVHGGPTSQDTDSFVPTVAAWVDAGYAVVRVNYRGSTGYGSAWRDAIEKGVGLTELEDIRAVRDRVVESGLADPRRVVLAGGSWGGYLTLLGLGVHPDAWSAGVASVPVADYVAAYQDEMEGLRAFDRALFGGTPDDVPELYARSSPITYVDDVVAPVLVLAGENDPRCPIRQIENYLARLTARNATFEVYRFDAGHGSLVTEERIRQVEAEIGFANRCLGLGG